MTNVEVRMTKKRRFLPSGFVVRHSFVIRQWAFVISPFGFLR